MKAPLDPRIGLCSRCAHAHVVTTPRSRFWLCGLSRTDARFARYPRLPIASCEGFEALADYASPAEGPPPRES